MRALQKTTKSDAQTRLVHQAFTCRVTDPLPSSGTTAGWLCLWFRCMALSAVAEKVRPIGPKAGAAPQRTLSPTIAVPGDVG